MKKILFIFVFLPLSVFFVFAIFLEVSERSKPDQSFARKIGQSDASCPDYIARHMSEKIVQNKLPTSLIDENLLRMAREQCSKRVPW